VLGLNSRLFATREEAFDFLIGLEPALEAELEEVKVD
jgi:hypothetical protein